MLPPEQHTGVPQAILRGDNDIPEMPQNSPANVLSASCEWQSPTYVPMQITPCHSNKVSSESQRHLIQSQHRKDVSVMRQRRRAKRIATSQGLTEGFGDPPNSWSPGHQRTSDALNNIIDLGFLSSAFNVCH